jgi:hypothetical protein
VPAITLGDSQIEQRDRKEQQWGLYGSEISLIIDKEVLCEEHNAGGLASRHGEEPT